MQQYTVEPVGDAQDSFFRSVHGRTLNTLNPSYLLPVDADEVKVTLIFSRCRMSY